MPPSEQIEMSQQFADLVFLALDHGIDSVRASGGPLIPFVVFEQEGTRELRRFVAERLEDSQQKAREDIAAFPPSVTAYAIAYDGFLTVQGTKFDSRYAEACPVEARGVETQEAEPRTQSGSQHLGQ